MVASPSFPFNSLNGLKGKRLAVQYQTTPHILFSQLEGFTYSTFRTADEVLDALAKGEADASLLWGPVAGYENKRKFANRWKVTPLTGTDMNGQVSVAVRRDKPELGRIKFNDQCSHCHGADGASPIRERDVRRLNIRCDAKWHDLALATIKNGRSDLGMPAWKEILSEAELQQVFSFIETIEK